MRLQAPNGAVIDAAEGAVEQLKANGFKPLDEPKPAPKRRASRKKLQDKQ